MYFERIIRVTFFFDKISRLNNVVAQRVVVEILIGAGKNKCKGVSDESESETENFSSVIPMWSMLS